RQARTRFFPSTYPRSRRPRRNSSMRAAIAEVEVPRNPIRGTFVGCCASADMQSAKSRAQSATQKTFLLIVNCCVEIGVLECWSNAVNRIVPILHDSTTPTLHVFT